MSEQQAATAVQATTTSACPHPEAVGKRWGDPISEERQAELQGYLDRWAAETDHGERKGPFDGGPRNDGVPLTGADVSWLAEQSGRGEDEYAPVPDLHLERADLSEAHLEGAHLGGAHLERAGLDNAWMDKTTTLNGAALDRASLDQLSFDGANLAVVKWETVRVLGDEVRARATTDDMGKRKERLRRLDDYEAAVRAHLQLAAVLRSQGMSEQADRFAYQAQKLQRARYRLQRRFGRWLFAWVLYLLAGYGYRPGRTLFWYVATVASFAVAFFVFGPAQGHVFQPDGALVFSVTSFHGRGFFPGGLDVEDTVTKLAALEAVIGLFIEISFIGAIRSLETVARRRGMRGIPTGVTTGGSLTGANSCPSW